MTRKLFLIFTLMLLGWQAQSQCTASFTSVRASDGNDLLRYALSNTTIPAGSNQRGFYEFFCPSGGVTFVGNHLPGSTTYAFFTAPGVYQIKLAISVINSSTGQTCYDTATSNVVVSYPPCGFTVTPTSSNTVSGEITFTINMPVPATGMSYNWGFGDLATGTSSGNTTHVYRRNDAYMVSVNGSNGPSCRYINNTYINVDNVKTDCTGNAASFATGYNQNIITFTNTSAAPTNNNHVQVYYWDFGDNTSSTQRSPVHTYNNIGTYPVQSVSIFYDTAKNAYCYDTARANVNITFVPNMISGRVVRKGLAAQVNDTFRVWLITKDANNKLAAIDSTDVGGLPRTTISNGYLNTQFQFNNLAAGAYYLKAERTNKPLGTNGPVPGYRDTTVYWANAVAQNAVNGLSYNGIDITLHSANGVTGSNTLSGSITGTNNSNILVLLYDIITFEIVRAVKTDANGNFTFTNLPDGTFTVFPEKMNYYSTGSLGYTLSTSNTTITDVNFGKDETNMTIKPFGAAVPKITANMFCIAPNPAQNTVQLAFVAQSNNPLSVEIVDVNGKIVYAQHSKTTPTSLNIDVTNLPNGMYFIKVNNDAKVGVQKMIVHH